MAILSLVGASCAGQAAPDPGAEEVGTGPYVPAEGGVPDTPVEEIPLRSFLGNPFSGDTLANLDVGGSDHASVAYRFVAERSGRIKSVRPFIVVNTSREGYAAGTGGTVRVSLVADDGTGLPDPEQVLARGQIEMDLIDGHLRTQDDTGEKKAQNFSAIGLSGQQGLIAGQTYHVLFEQIDSDPVSNYVGLDLMLQYNPELGPRPSISSWGVTLKEGDSGWRDFTQRFGEELYTPIMAIRMEDGYVYGNGYIEAFSEERSFRPIDQSASIQVEFQPNEDFEATRWWIRAYRTGDNGVMRAHLEGSDGTDEMIELPATEFPQSEMRWIEWPWEKAFSADVEYVLTLTGDQGGEFTLHPLREGADYDYESGSFFGGVSRPSDGNGGYDGWHKELTADSFTSADIMMAWTLK